MTATAETRPRFEDFWRTYMLAHQNATCRRLHYIGTAGGLTALVAAIATLNAWWIPAGFVFGYGCAWAGHFFAEGNRPLAFQKPWWSLLADHRMLFLAIAGRIQPELEAARASAR